MAPNYTQTRAYQQDLETTPETSLTWGVDKTWTLRSLLDPFLDPLLDPFLDPSFFEQSSCLAARKVLRIPAMYICLSAFIVQT